jgi:hypothetical protein
MTSDEGGLIEEEYMNLYAVDRVNTTGTTWLGMTVGCAQCHDHKYDPITQKDYYRLYGFFNNVPETGKDGVRDRNPKPFLLVPRTPEEKARMEGAERELAEAEARLKAVSPELEKEYARWLAEEPLRPAPADPGGLIGEFSFNGDGNGKDEAGKPIAARVEGEASFPRGRPRPRRAAGERKGSCWQWITSRASSATRLSAPASGCS